MKKIFSLALATLFTASCMQILPFAADNADVIKDGLNNDVVVSEGAIDIDNFSNAFCVEKINLLSTNLPDAIYLGQADQDLSEGTCTLCAAAMMMRARMYLSNNSLWSSITESSIKSVAWSNGLKWSYDYSIDGNSISVRHNTVSGMSASTLKSLLNSHPEGVVIYCRSIPHAVFITDYEGDTFYCADPWPSYSGKRMPLTSKNVLMNRFGSQANILNNINDYWYISSYNIKNAQPSAEYKWCIDQPQPNSTYYNEDVVFSGWSISKGNPVKAVQFSLNGHEWWDMERYSRPEVSAAYPGYDSGAEGFRTKINRTRFKNHRESTLEFRTVYQDGQIKSMGSVNPKIVHDFRPLNIGKYNGNIYLFYDDVREYDVLVNGLLPQYDAHLATINNKSENDWITQEAHGKRYWIGLNDGASEGNFVWIDGSRSSYRNWKDGEPNNYAGVEDYVAIVENGVWNDYAVDAAFASWLGFILEYEEEDLNKITTKSFNGNKYEFYDCVANYQVAEFIAKEKGGQILTINSKEENDFIKSNIDYRVWLGLNDVGNKGSFVWPTGESLNYTNWASGRPDNSATDTRDYVAMDTSGKWEDLNSMGDGCKFVIEYPGQGETTTGKKGDVNGDGTITTKDAVLALQMSTGKKTKNSAADVNGDGSVTTKDAVLILRYSTGKIQSF